MAKQSSENKKPIDPRNFIRINWFFITLPIVMFFILNLVFSVEPKLTTWSEFENKMLNKQAVEKVDIVNNETAEIYIKKEKIADPFFKDVLTRRVGSGYYPGPHYVMNIGSAETFERKLNEAQAGFKETEKVNVIYTKRKNWFYEIASWVIPFLLVFFMIRFLSRTMFGGPGQRDGNSIFNFGRSTAILFDNKNKNLTTFDDVAGLEEAKQEVKEIVDFLKEPGLYTRLGAKIPKGVIIIGPPGTGKTLLVKAVANEAQVPFFSLSGSEFVEMFVGVGASRVRDLFKKAKEKTPCIIFIDEIDAVGRSRGRNSLYTGSNDERESTLNQLLTEMDGFGTNSGIIVLAATNRADMLDPALLRRGRFDRHIYLELPNLNERKAIFQVHLKPIVMEDAIDVDFLAAQTPGSSGADIANICNEAALIAARNKKEKVSKHDFLEAIDRIVAGIERKSMIITPEEKKVIAYHEAGHAVVSWLLKNVDPLIKVSIIPRGRSLGASWYLPEERQLKSKAQFNDMLCAGLGGRVAEEIMFGDVTSGALDDLEKVTKQAYLMVAYYGFDKKLGNISFYDSTGMNEMNFQKPYSEETGKIIDEEVRAIIDEAYNRTKSLLSQNKDKLIALADLLQEKELVEQHDLESLLGKREERTESNVNKKLVDV